MDYLKESARTASGSFHSELVPHDYLMEQLESLVQAANLLDLAKKAFFYGKPLPAVESELTSSPSHIALMLKLNAKQSDINLFHGLLGLITEAGELAEILLKWFGEGHEVDQTNLNEELGDMRWYDAMLLRETGWSDEDIKERNIAKLRARYPDKFTEEQANQRNLDLERQALEAPCGGKVGNET